MPQEDQRALQKLLDEASEHIERGIQQPLERKRHDEAELRRAKRTISEWQQTLDVHSPAAEDQLSARTSTRCETSVPRSTGAPKKYFSRVIFSRSTGVYARAERAGSAPAIFSKQVTHISNQGMEPLAVEPPQAHVPHQENPPKKPTVKAPLLDSVGLKAWQDLLGLIDEAEKRGADLSGVFVVPLATDIDGAELAATRTPGFIDCFKSVLKPSESGITSLSYEGKSLFNMGQVPECPKACSAEEVIRDFEGRLYSQGEAFRPAPYAVNVDTADADDPKQRTNHLLSKHSVFDHFLVNGLRRTKISYPGIHTPQIFVTAQKSGDHSARTEISIYRHPNVWITVAPTHLDRFETAIRKEFGIDRALCSQFLRHRYLWISPDFLVRHGILHSVVLQEQGQTIVVLPKAYQWGLNAGPNVAEAVNWSDNPVKIGDYTACSQLCSPGNQQDFVDADGLSMLEGDDIDSETSSRNSPLRPQLGDLGSLELRPRPKEGMQAPATRPPKRPLKMATPIISQYHKRARLLDLEATSDPSTGPEPN
ncbi:MAG: hypothetical protein MMC23_004544 [Stictis urceolatum]|nr:hypothetical protein [Stictis urceolata]